MRGFEVSGLPPICGEYFQATFEQARVVGTFYRYVNLMLVSDDLTPFVGPS